MGKHVFDETLLRFATHAGQAQCSPSAEHPTGIEQGGSFIRFQILLGFDIHTLIELVLLREP